MTKLAKTNQFNRIGTVHYRVESRDEADLISTLVLSVDFERAPVPDNSYIADYFEVHRTDADVMLVFGKKAFPSETELRNKIEIYFPFDPFMHQLWKSTRKMHENLRKSFDANGKIAKAQGDLNSGDVKVQTVTANNALIVMSAGQCVIDFFLIAAKDIWLKTKKGDPLNVEAIVRVFVSEQLLLGLLNRIDYLADELKAVITVPVEDSDEDVESVDFR